MTVLALNNIEQVDKLVREVFTAGMNMRTPVFPKVFNIGTPTRLDEKYQIIKLDNTVSETVDGGAFTPSDIKEIGGKTITQKIYKDSVSIGDFAELFDNYGKIRQAAFEKGQDYMYEMDAHGADFFNNATSSASPYGFIVDGTSTATSLISNTQPVGDTGDTQDNLVSGGLDKPQLNTAREYLRKQKRHNGNIAGYQASRLLMPVELGMTAFELTKSPIGPTADNRKNYINSLGIELIEWDLLTSSSMSFLMAPKGATRFEFLIKLRPQLRRIISQTTGTPEYQWRAVYQAGVVDYQGCVGITS